MEIHPVIHIGFLDYTLFEESTEFYATYKLINVKNHDIYSDNFTLSVVNLSRIDLATEEEYYREIRTYKKIISEKDALIQRLSAELEKLKADTGQ